MKHWTELSPEFLRLWRSGHREDLGEFVDRVETLWLDIALYQVLRGGSDIPLPKAVQSKKAVVGISGETSGYYSLEVGIFI